MILTDLAGKVSSTGTLVTPAPYCHAAPALCIEAASWEPPACCAGCGRERMGGADVRVSLHPPHLYPISTQRERDGRSLAVQISVTLTH